MQRAYRRDRRGPAPDGYIEPPLLTLGQDFGFLAGLPPGEYTAADVVDYLLGQDHGEKRPPA